MADEKRRVSFEGRLGQAQYDQKVIDGQIDESTLYFIKDSKRIYVGHECFNVPTAQFGGIPVEYTTELPDGTLWKRIFSEDGDEWRLTFLEKGPGDTKFKARHTFEFAIERSSDGTELGVIRIDNKNVGFSNAHAVFCEDIDQVVEGVKTFTGDLRVNDVPRTDQSAVNKKWVTERLSDLHDETRTELADEAAKIRDEMRIESERVDGEVARLDGRIDDEASARKSNDQALDDRITFEADRLETLINQEAKTREEEDDDLRDLIGAEQRRAIGREDQLEEMIEREIQDRIDHVDAEEARATKREEELDEKIDEMTQTLRDEAAEYDSKVVHLAGDETVTGQKTFEKPILGSVERLTTPREIITDLESDDSHEFDGTSDVEPGVKGILPIGHGGTGRPYLRDHIGAFVRMAEEHEEVDFPGTPAEERRSFYRIKFSPDMTEVNTQGAVKSVTVIGDPEDFYLDSGLSFAKYEGGYAYYTRTPYEFRNQVILQQTELTFKVIIESGGIDYEDVIRAVLVPVWGVRQNWILGDWAWKLDSQDDDREFYDTNQIQALLQNVEDLGVVDSAFDPMVPYRIINGVSIKTRGGGYEKGDLLVLKPKTGDEWAAFDHARAYVESVDAAGGIQAVSLQYGGLYSIHHVFTDMEAYSNTSHTDGSYGQGVVLSVVGGQKYGRTLSQLEADPNIMIKPGMMVTVLRDETLTPTAAQRYKYFDENNDGKPEWHPWTPYKQSRDYRDDGKYTVVDNREMKDGRFVSLTEYAKKRIDFSAQTDVNEVITGDWKFEGKTKFENDVRIQAPVEEDNPATKKYVDDEVSKERVRALDAEGDLQFEHVVANNLTEAVNAEGTRAKEAEADLDDRVINLEEKDVQLTMSGDSEKLEEYDGALVSIELANELRNNVLDMREIHTTNSVKVTYDGTNGGRADVRISSYDVSGLGPMYERQPDGTNVMIAPDFKDNPTLETIGMIGTDENSIGMRVRKNSIREEHLTKSVYSWINRKVELKNLTRIRDDDLVFMNTDQHSHRVEVNQRPWELDQTGKYGDGGWEDQQVDWLKREDLVLKRLDQSIQGVKEFIGLTYSERPAPPRQPLPGVIYEDGDYDGENAIQLPEKFTDVHTDGKDLTGSRYGEMRNAATEYQVFRLLHDAFSDEGETGPLGKNGLVGTFQTDGQVMRERETSFLQGDITKWDNSTRSWTGSPVDVHPATEHPTDKSHDEIFESGFNILTTYHDLLERKTYQETLSFISDDVLFIPQFDDGLVKISGVHLMNRDQNKDETVNGVKTFEGNGDMLDTTNKSAVFEKPVLIESTRRALEDNGPDEPTASVNPALTVIGGTRLGTDAWLVEGKDQVLFDDELDPDHGFPADYHPSAHRYATELQVYNTIKEMATVIVQKLEEVKTELKDKLDEVKKEVEDSRNAIMGDGPNNTIEAVSEKLEQMTTGITDAIADMTEKLELKGDEVVTAVTDGSDAVVNQIDISEGNLTTSIEGASETIVEAIGGAKEEFIDSVDGFISAQTEAIITGLETVTDAQEVLRAHIFQLTDSGHGGAFKVSVGGQPLEVKPASTGFAVQATGTVSIGGQPIAVTNPGGFPIEVKPASTGFGVQITTPVTLDSGAAVKVNNLATDPVNTKVVP